MLISPNTFINGTEVDCSNFSHPTMPYAALVRFDGSETGEYSGYRVRNHMTGRVYACFNNSYRHPELSLEMAVEYCCKHFDVWFNIPTTFVASAQRIEPGDRITFSSPSIEDGEVMTKVVQDVYEGYISIELGYQPEPIRRVAYSEVIKHHAVPIELQP